MSENEQETAAAETGIPAVPSHQAGPAPSTAPDAAPADEADEVAAGHPNKKEPHAGTDT